VGTLFNPPAPVTLPNVDGLPPRTVVEMSSYDHDLAAFVAIGTGTVSADGLLVVSDLGVGVLKSGWFFGCPSGNSGGACHAQECWTCGPSGTPMPDTGQDGRTCYPRGGDKPHVCSNGDCVPVTATLKEVTFSGTGFHNVAKDADGSAFGTPQWTASDDRFPVCYTRSTRVKVAAKLKLDHSVVGATAKVKAQGPDGLQFVGSATLAGDEVTLAPTDFAADLPSKINRYNPFKIGWQVSLDDGGHYTEAVSSENKMYVTLADPGTLANPLYQTTLDIGTRNATGKESASEATPAIWADFSSLSASRGVARCDGVQMGYWTGGSGTCQSLGAMLQSSSGDGSCVAWAQLWQQTLEAVGITGSKILMITADQAVNPGADGFLVKNWTFGRHLRTGPDGVNNSDRSGDDVEVIPKGKGKPDQPCVGPGADGSLHTTPVGDDTVLGNQITTGADGICNTTKAADDTQSLAVGKGLPDAMAITPGPNGTLESATAGDDSLRDGQGSGTYPYLLFTWTDVWGTKGSPRGDAAEQPGIAGQKNANPPPEFYNHFIVKYDGKLWDPSYGAGPFASELDHKNGATDGIMTVIGVDLWGNKNASATQSLKYQPVQ
jgi:hypothetical protein